MESQRQIDLFDAKQKAIDHAIWLNFINRACVLEFGVIHGPNNNWAVSDVITVSNMGMSFIDILPKNYSQLDYDHIRHIRMDNHPLPHWEKIVGIFSTTDGDILRFILTNDIPLEKFIRDELAGRGYDENHRWCGFENAQKIWLK